MKRKYSYTLVICAVFAVMGLMLLGYSSYSRSGGAIIIQDGGVNTSTPEARHVTQDKDGHLNLTQ